MLILGECKCSAVTLILVAKVSTDKMACMKTPPLLDNEEHYEQWRKNVEVWVELTDLDKKKHALAIHMQLRGRAQLASSDFSIEEMKKDGAVKNLLDKLDKLFLHEKGRRQFLSFRDLYRVKRQSGESVDEFISNFEHINFKLKSQDVSLPDTVLSFMLLEACNLEDKDEQLILSSMSEISLDTMKASLKRVFGGISNQNKESVKVKQESVLYEQEFEGNSNKETFYVSRSRGRGRFQVRGGNERGRGGYNRGGYHGNQHQNKRRNPVDKEGNIMKCLICNSTYHFARYCPYSHDESNENKKFDIAKVKSENDDETSVETVQLSLIVAFSGEKKSEKLNNLVKDSSCAAVLDCGALSSVCGKG